eukprot:CAMPEP_0201550592 /NCGR_PEP_ID=MMETSP0173_2-20130828/6941_1 /ASSEMBLY_ACC=CAM_ASM_000268 /TAXON_ID=218659 /ORGANISM="Vexillifera sp., Strain DIVA3 564/2" /LENGTH=182 /DNA_ID=CAMNT_0047960615 /DNA_START=385 /DNA_END=929 /DNA_ORIENTATION=-
MKRNASSSSPASSSNSLSNSAGNQSPRPNLIEPNKRDQLSLVKDGSFTSTSSSSSAGSLAGLSAGTLEGLIRNDSNSSTSASSWGTLELANLDLSDADDGALIREESSTTFLKMPTPHSIRFGSKLFLEINGNTLTLRVRGPSNVRALLFVVESLDALIEDSLHLKVSVKIPCVRCEQRQES